MSERDLDWVVDLSVPTRDRVSLHRTPQCIRCGRFCHILEDTLAYNGSFTQNYVKFNCSRCGVFTESMW